MTRILLSAVAAAALSLLAACGEESQTKASDAAHQAKSAVSSAVAEFQKSSSETLAAIDRELGELKVKASSAADTAKEDLDKAVADLDVQRKALGAKLEELKTAAPEKAQAMLDKVKSELAELKQKAQDAAAKFK